MTAEYQQWQKLKNNYLKQVEHALAAIDHPKNTDILRDVDEHLERKYAELPPDKQNWEGFQQILIEMGPPQDYAELLAQEKPAAEKSKSGLNAFLAVVFVIVLMVIGGYLIYTAQKTPAPAPSPVAKPFVFEPDVRVLGRWVTVDFVKTIDEFNPAKKTWKGELFLKSLTFEDKGILWWANKNSEPYKHQWTKGKVDPLEERPAFYYLKTIDGINYLFFEWVSGDVTIRGREPFYYVSTQNPGQVEFNIQSPVVTIKKRTTDEEPNLPVRTERIQIASAPPVLAPLVLGKWRVVDCVKRIEDFHPDQPTYKKALILKELHFTSAQIVYWNFNNNVVKETPFTKDTLETIKGHQAKYCINTIDGQDYLFVEWITPDVVKEGKVPDYYVLARQEQFCMPENAMDEPPVNNLVIIKQDNANTNDTDVVGQWVSVDFVRNIASFRPGEKQWKGDLYLKGLTFYDDGTTSGPWTWKQNYLWHPGDRTKANYTIQQMQGTTYLFMEWMSGDVTIRGQKPCYYVLKKVSARSTATAQKYYITIGANNCNAGYIRSLLGAPKSVDSGGRILRYTDDGVDFCFSDNGPLLEVHLNRGYTGRLKTGVSLASTKQEVLAAYGQPTRTVQASDLHGKTDERILYQKDNISRIYYGRDGLIFWFKDSAVTQIVVFKGNLVIE